jgi:saccharopine dehydrogenase-like NADP-dependent oxidoreductase
MVTAIKVVQLGCGITGLVCAEHLEKHPKVDELILADKQVDVAGAMIKRLRSEKAVAQKMDAGDPSQLKKVLKGCDLIVTSVPSEMNMKLLEAAVSAGVNYVDLTVPFELIPKLEEMDERCKKAGVIALTGVGSDPGISDVFAVRAAEILDEVLEIRIRDADNAVSAEHEYFTLWSPRDMLEELTMNAAIYENGKITWLPPLHEMECFRFPDPIGQHPVYNTTHEETFLLPKFIEGVKHVDFKIVVWDNLVKLANTIRKIGMHNVNAVRVDGFDVKPIDVVAECLPRPVDLIGKVKGSSCVLVEVVGVRAGEKTVVRTWVAMTHEEAFRNHRTSATGYVVGTGAAAGVELIVSGDLRKSGLYAPEMLPTEKFVENVVGKGLKANQEIVTL